MLDSSVRQITAMINEHLARELSENGQIREKILLGIKWCMLSQQAFVSVITAAMHELVSSRPWANATLSKLTENRRYKEHGRTLLVPTGPNALCIPPINKLNTQKGRLSSLRGGQSNQGNRAHSSAPHLMHLCFIPCRSCSHRFEIW